MKSTITKVPAPLNLGRSFAGVQQRGVVLQPSRKERREAARQAGKIFRPTTTDIRDGVSAQIRGALKRMTKDDIEAARVAEYEQLVKDGLSDYEARETVWPSKRLESGNTDGK